MNGSGTNCDEYNISWGIPMTYNKAIEYNVDEKC